MGAKTGLLAYADGPAPDLLRGVTRPDLERTDALVRRLYPSGNLEKVDGSNLSEGCYPPDRLTYAGSFPGIDVLGDQRFMIDRPSQLPEHLAKEGQGRRTILHAMHSVVDWLAFAVWEDGQLVRSLSLSPDGGVIEDIGAPLPFEMPYWAGEHPVTPVPGWPNQEPYPLPFHPLDMGEDALRALFGFILEGRPSPSRRRCRLDPS